MLFSSNVFLFCFLPIAILVYYTIAQRHLTQNFLTLINRYSKNKGGLLLKSAFVLSVIVFLRNKLYLRFCNLANSRLITDCLQSVFFA